MLCGCDATSVVRAALFGVEADVELHRVGLDFVGVVDGQPPRQPDCIRGGVDETLSGFVDTMVRRSRVPTTSG